MNNICFNKEIEREFKNYGKYIKYVREEKIKQKNYNWIILDSSYSKYKKIVKEIESYNTFDSIITKVIVDINFISNRGALQVDSVLNSIIDSPEEVKTLWVNGLNRAANSVCNILVLGNITKEEALNAFGDYFSFFIDLNTETDTVSKREIIEKILSDNNFTLEDKDLLNELEKLPIMRVERILTKGFITALQQKRNTIKEGDLFESYSEEAKNVLAELDSLIGQQKVKEGLKEIYNYCSISRKRNDNGVCKNMLFLGNPGTGKTTVAQIVSRLFATIDKDKLKRPILFESRETLVGRYVGESEAKFLNAVKKAQGGILFIDEAYSLASGGSKRDFGYRIIECLVNQMDIHKYDITFILAGYKKEMMDFLKSNPRIK